MKAVGQRELRGKGKSNQPRGGGGGGNSLRCFPSPQPLPGEEDQREEFSLLAVADKTPDPAAGFACWEAPEPTAAAAEPFSSFSSTSLARTASHWCLLAKSHCHRDPKDIPAGWGITTADGHRNSSSSSLASSPSLPPQRHQEPAEEWFQ